MTPRFVFMLTRNDATVADADARLEQALAAGVRHIGFKDVGLPIPDLKRLAERIRSAAAEVYLEVVSLDEASERRSAEAALHIGVDHLMGGTRARAVVPIIAGSAIAYWPFAGRIVGHPSRLEGTVEEIAEHAALLCAIPEVHGIDLLAYRFGGDVEELLAAVIGAVSKPVLVAGSIDRDERLAAVIGSGAEAFTVGTAALDGVFPARSGELPDQLDYIQKRLAS